jgi:hypothetical protein
VASAELDAMRQAAFTTSSLTAGDHVIVACYEGDADFTASTSPELTQTVTMDGLAPRP